MKRKDFVKYLNKHNCVLLKHGSKHDKFINLDSGTKTMLPRHKELKTFLCRAICKQLEIPMVEKK